MATKIIPPASQCDGRAQLDSFLAGLRAWAISADAPLAVDYETGANSRLLQVAIADEEPTPVAEAATEEPAADPTEEPTDLE